MIFETIVAENFPTNILQVAKRKRIVAAVNCNHIRIHYFNSSVFSLISNKDIPSLPKQQSTSFNTKKLHFEKCTTNLKNGIQ